MASLAKDFNAITSVVNTNGDPFNGGELRFFKAGTTTPKDVWTTKDKQGGTDVTVMTLDVRGMPTTQIYGDGLYKVELYENTQAGLVLRRTFDDISIFNNMFPADSFTDARDFGDGSLTSATLQAAITAIGADETTLVLSAGDWAVTANLTFPKNITLWVPQGAFLDVSIGIVVTIDSPPLVGIYQWIKGTGATSPVNFTCAETIYAEWFGAVQDGTTPVETEFQYAVDSLVNGGELRILEGPSFYRTEANINVTNNNTTIKGPGTIKLFVRAANRRGFAFSGIDNAIVDNIEILADTDFGTNEDFSKPVEFLNCTNVLVKDSHMANCNYGVYIESCINFTVKSCLLQPVTPALLQGSGVSMVSSSKGWVLFNEIKTDGSGNRYEHAIYPAGCDEVEIIGNIGDGPQVSGVQLFDASCTDINILDNTIKNSQDRGILIAGTVPHSNITVDNNKIENCLNTGAEKGIGIVYTGAGTAENIKIINNTIKNVSKQGVNISIGTGGTVSNITVDNNDVIDWSVQTADTFFAIDYGSSASTFADGTITNNKLTPGATGGTKSYIFSGTISGLSLIGNQGTEPFGYDNQFIGDIKVSANAFDLFPLVGNVTLPSAGTYVTVHTFSAFKNVPFKLEWYTEFSSNVEAFGTILISPNHPAFDGITVTTGMGVVDTGHYGFLTGVVGATTTTGQIFDSGGVDVTAANPASRQNREVQFKPLSATVIEARQQGSHAGAGDRELYFKISPLGVENRQGQ